MPTFTLRFVDLPMTHARAFVGRRLLAIGAKLSSALLHFKFLPSIVAGLVSCLLVGCASMRPSSPRLPIVDLQLNRDWRCSVEGADTICKPVSSRDALKKVIIWSAKDRGPSDSLNSYRTHLSEVKKWKDRFRTVTSVPISNRVVAINGRDWVDAVQSDSEVKNFTTRYLASVSENKAVLITLSARKEIYAEFEKEMQPYIDRLVLNE